MFSRTNSNDEGEKENGKNPNDVQSMQITLKVKGQDDCELSFKMKRTAPLEVLMKRYCEEMYLDIKSLVFLYDGRYVKPFHTPEKLGMEEDDLIDAMLHMNGGAII
ncbi:small ubiquitin-related modifier 1-like [Humulus lupulus]|uniref:small ubiquitin-related modifier 1-like n=1 Tax=Humulus lupulus TaxID=3486 RepID=UPI002B411480|nr:small ubiquitin-related modifier 1-like [Humulus lupulus]